MGPPSYIWSVVDRNVVMRRKTGYFFRNALMAVRCNSISWEDGPSNYII